MSPIARALSSADLQRSSDPASYLDGVAGGEVANDASAFRGADTTEGDGAGAAGFSSGQSQAASEHASLLVELHFHAADLRTGGGLHTGALHGECDFGAPRRYRARDLRKRGQKGFLAMRLVKLELEVSVRVYVF